MVVDPHSRSHVRHLMGVLQDLECCAGSARTLRPSLLALSTPAIWGRPLTQPRSLWRISWQLSPNFTSCQIPTLGTGPREQLYVPYFLSLELSLIWVCSLPASLPAPGPPAPSHLIETLGMATSGAAACPQRHHVSICL